MGLKVKGVCARPASFFGACSWCSELAVLCASAVAMPWGCDLDHKRREMVSEVSRVGMSVRVYLAKHLPVLETICKLSFHNKLT